MPIISVRDLTTTSRLGEVAVPAQRGVSLDVDAHESADARLVRTAASLWATSSSPFSLFH
jgi:hypothetical protein